MDHWNDVICIDSWRLDDTWGDVFPKGAREKTAYFSPSDEALPHLKPNHRYLFKKSSHRYPWQFWMEIIAYRIGGLMGVGVPPAFPAYSSKEGAELTCGALIEWFYAEDSEYVEGGQFMRVEVPGFDPKRGTGHNLGSVLSFLQTLLNESDYRHIGTRHWAKVLCFDSVIGNVDRHQDNWGLIFTPGLQGAVVPSWSPAFDNGTALGHEILEHNISKYDDRAALKKYLEDPRHARHHMSWDLDEAGSMNFFDFMKRYSVAFPDTRDLMLRCLAFNEPSLRNEIAPLCKIEVPENYTLTQARLDFVIRLVMERRAILEARLNT